MKSKEWSAEVLSVENRGGGYHVLSLRLPKTFPNPAAGAFLMLSAGAEPNILLRRPMAIYDLAPKGKEKQLDILFNVVGRGTKELSMLKTGREISLLAPIGNSFSKPRKNKKIWVVAGGIGIAPFLLYLRQLSTTQKKQVRFYFGFRSKDQRLILKDFTKAGHTPACAIEGPGGDFRGTVVDFIRAELKKDKPHRILTCGPEKMMDAVLDAGRSQHVPVEASLETKMACGIGVCLSCVTRTDSDGKYHLVCQEGPVFELTGQP